MKNKPRNMADSVSERLRRHARPGSGGYLLTLKRFAIERLLYRLSKSEARDQFVLKGAMLFSIWGEQLARPTRDLDLLGSGASTPEQLSDVFRRICEAPVVEDGLEFPAKTIRADRILAGEEYVGVRLNLEALLLRSRIPVQVDVGFGDKIVPPPTLAAFPTLLDFPAPRIRAYPREAVVAEKLHAMIRHGDKNTRAKDFYDVHVLSSQFAFEGEMLSRSIEATFRRRSTPFPVVAESAMTRAWYGDSKREELWRAFLRRDDLTGAPSSLEELGTRVVNFLWPPLSALGSEKVFTAAWQPGGPWK